MTFCMVGAGKVASQLAPALKEAGYKPLGVYSRSMEHAASLASRIGTTGVDRITALPAGADIYLIAVKDDAIADVAAELAPHVAPGGGRAVMVHTSGSTPLSVLSTTGARCGVMYPLYSFTADYRQDVGDVPFFIEASDADVQRLLLAVAGSISRRPVTVMDSATRRRMPPEIMKKSVSMKGLYQLQRRFPKPVMLLRWLKTTIRMPIPLARSINASLCFIFF